MKTITVIHQRPSGARAAVAAVALAVGALVPAAAQAGPVEDVEQHCLAGATGSADSLERWADRCRDVAAQYEAAYSQCMRTAPGTADSLEHWVDHCAIEATAMVDRR